MEEEIWQNRSPSSNWKRFSSTNCVLWSSRRQRPDTRMYPIEVELRSPSYRMTFPSIEYLNVTIGNSGVLSLFLDLWISCFSKPYSLVDLPTRPWNSRGGYFQSSPWTSHWTAERALAWHWYHDAEKALTNFRRKGTLVLDLIFVHSICWSRKLSSLVRSVVCRGFKCCWVPC